MVRPIDVNKRADWLITLSALVSLKGSPWEAKGWEPLDSAVLAFSRRRTGSVGIWNYSAEE